MAKNRIIFTNDFVLRNGNIGIGTTNPTEKLDVAGDVNVSGLTTTQDLYVTGVSTVSDLYVNGALYDNNNSRGNLNEVLVSVGAGLGVTWKSLEIAGYAQINSSSPSTPYYLIGVEDATGITSSFYTGTDVVLTGDGRLGIGTTNLTQKLDVGGNIKVNTATLGTRGTNNVFFGFGALNTVTAGVNCVAIGVQALNSNNGNDNIAIGYRALYNNQSANNTAIGFRALENNQGLSNTAIGYWAIRDNTTGVFNSALGNDALYQNTSGNYNVAMGKLSAGENLSGSYNIHLGSHNGNTTNRSGIVVIGSGSGAGVNAFDVPKDANNQLAIGRNISGTNNYWIVGNENYDVGIGTTNPSAKLDVDGNLKVSGIITATTYDTLYTNFGSFVSTSSTTSQVGIHSTLSITSYRSVEYTIQATQANNFHATKILALHDGTIAYPSEYGTIFNNTTIASFDVDVSGGNIRLLSTPASSGITTYTINFTATKL